MSHSSQDPHFKLKSSILSDILFCGSKQIFIKVSTLKKGITMSHSSQDPQVKLKSSILSDILFCGSKQIFNKVFT